MGVANGTTLTVTVSVNGQPVEDVPPGATVPDVVAQTAPSLPWTVEARSPSGRLLATLYVGTPVASDAGSTRADFDLSCGRITIWTGKVGPSGPATAPSPGMPGDCGP